MSEGIDDNLGPAYTADYSPTASKHVEADQVAKWWWIGSMLYFPAFTTLGLILAIKFFNPTFLSDAAWLTFGRIRPAHVNGVLFGFVSTGLIGGMFYIVPRLSAIPIFHPKLAKLSSVIWNIGVLGGIIGILLGFSQAREYAELPWLSDMFLATSLALNAIVILGTIMRRLEHKLYVSLWFFGALVVWFPIMYSIGNVIWNPPSGALNGTLDALFNWYYGHNVLGLWFTPLGIGIWYYAIIRIIRKSLYSNILSLISFFALALFYTGLGAHHILQAPVPEWDKTIAVVSSIMMQFSVLAFAINIGMSVRGSWHYFANSIPFRFIIFGFFCYIFVSIQGSVQALRDMNLYLHFSQWPVGHAHLALLGAFGFLAAGIMFWLVPRVTGRAIFSKRMMSLAWWLAFTGFIFFFSAMTIAGLEQNAAWFFHMTVVQALPTLTPMFLLRAIGGGVVVLAAYVFAINIILTFFVGHKIALLRPEEIERHK